MFDLGTVWLTEDLRLRDNPLLQRAACECRQRLCVYCLDAVRTEPNRYGLKSMGPHRERFLRQGLAEPKNGAGSWPRSALLARAAAYRKALDVL